MLILKILDHDLHRARSATAVPLWIETPAKPESLPALVSSSRGAFLVSKRLTAEGRIRTGVFKHDSDRLDSLIGPMMDAAYDLSKSEGWKNWFSSCGKAFDYVQAEAGTTVQPHACLVPDTWDAAAMNRWGGRDLSSDKNVQVFRKTCRVYQCNVSRPVFTSRPDFVGLLTQIVGGRTSVLLHNTRRGVSFHDFRLP